MPRFLHILGTDTDVGKTWVTFSLFQEYRRRGLKVLVLKPVHSGWPADQDWGEDLGHYTTFHGQSYRPEDLCAYRFVEPMSPFGAAELEGKTIEAKVLNEHWKRWEEYPVDIVLVEGIGGVMCPLAPKFTYLDWIRDKKCPALLVSKVGLGSLNQALLSLSALERAEVEVLGLLPNQEQYFPSVDPISGSFCSEMKQMTDIHLFSMQVRDMMKGGSSDRHKGEAREGEHESLEQQVGQISNPIQEIAERFLERF